VAEHCRTTLDRDRHRRRRRRRDLERPVLHRPVRVRRCRDESGQSIVEAALVFPVLALMIGIGLTGWSAMQQSIRITSAARAGAIKAANDLAADLPTPTAPQLQTAHDDATAAVNQEEGLTNVYQDTNSAQNNYVNMTEATDTLNGTGVTIDLVTVTVWHQVGQWIPIVSGLTAGAHATARYG